MKENKFVKSCVNILAILVLIILVLLFAGGLIVTVKFANTYYTEYNEKATFLIDNILVNFVILVIFLGILFLVNKLLKKAKEKILLVISLIVIALIGFFWVNYLKVPVRADQKFIYIAAFEFLEKNYRLLETGSYLFMHPMQLGIIYFVMLVYKVINIQSSIVFQNLNVVFVLIETFLLYKICKVLYKNEKVNKLFILLIPLFVAMPILSILVYGNIIGMIFSLLSIYLILKYLDERKIWKLIIAGFSIIVSIILKQNNQVILIAICVVLFLDFIKNFKKASVFFIIITAILAYLTIPIIYWFTEKISDVKVNNGVPMLSYIAMGMAKASDRAPGWYNIEYNVELIYSDNDYDGEKTSSQALQDIKDRLKYFAKNPKEFLIYYAAKLGTTWLEPTFQSIWFSESMEETTDEIEQYYSTQKLIPSMLTGKISKVITKFLDLYQIIVYGFSAISIIIDLKNKKIDEKNIILILIFFGGFLFHILWEVKSVYAIQYFYVLIPVAASGLEKSFECINKKLGKEIIENG